MRSSIIILIVALAGLLGGGASAWFAIERSQGFGAISVGPWTAIPYASAGEVDPYTIAKSVVKGSVPLGVTEGLAFNAVRDSEGRALTLACEYEIAGRSPVAKLWTLVTYDSSGKPVEPAPGGASALYSGRVLRYSDGSYRIALSRRARPGNWIGVSGTGAFRLTLRLYDTSISGTRQLDALRMPSIVRGECP
ncbi:MAG: DUF1214 domain-containing protein [Pseudomonadota bacterium]|nr:DUF1214 domain-containing protein [Pseudomonadota bacterium]